jgi:predicted amino acid-binding ACT domain protein
MRISGRLGATAAVALFAMALVAGCGDTVVDSAKLEDTLAAELQQGGEKISSVDCPSDVEVEKGEKFNCTVRFAGGEEEELTLEILNEDADVSLIDRSGGQQAQQG